MIPPWVTRLVQVFPPREVVDFDVPQVPRLGVYGGFGELVFKGQQLLWTGHALLCLREHPDQPITGGGRRESYSFPICVSVTQDTPSQIGRASCRERVCLYV